MKRPLFWLIILLLGMFEATTLASIAAASDSDRIIVSRSGKSFEFAKSKQAFIPIGLNYDHDRKGRLIEDYWVDEWKSVEEDFAEMKQLGANTVRIHLQFGKFMDSSTAANSTSLSQLEKLVRLAERSNLYLNLTGLGCYHKHQVPGWYDALSEQERWKAHENFWMAVARKVKGSPAIFCYDLMNEPVIPGAKRSSNDWLGPDFAGKHFVQFITLDPLNRARPQVARLWVEQLVTSIRAVDSQTLITLGLVDWSLDRPGLTSGFVPSACCEKLDFLSVHLYPKKGKMTDAVDILKGFDIGKPVVIEEIFPLQCSSDELLEFLRIAKLHSAGVFSFYWGQTQKELNHSRSMKDALLRDWLGRFSEVRAIFTH